MCIRQKKNWNHTFVYVWAAAELGQLAPQSRQQCAVQQYHKWHCKLAHYWFPRFRILRPQSHLGRYSGFFLFSFFPFPRPSSWKMQKKRVCSISIWMDHESFQHSHILGEILFVVCLGNAKEALPFYFCIDWFESVHTEIEETRFFGISQSYTNQNLAQNVALLEGFVIYSNRNRTNRLLLHLSRWRGWEWGKKGVNSIVPQIWLCSKDLKSRARIQILQTQPCLGYYSVFSTFFFFSPMIHNDPKDER